jgi:DcuC family C4-dicarboxylate transporter
MPESPPVTPALGLLVIAASVWLIARRWDVRLVLALGGLALFTLAGQTVACFGYFAREMANPATVVPIGSAMGFSHVLRLTGCDVHLIQLLLKPIRKVRALLVPGGVIAGYLINTTLVSQTSAAAVLGPILVPLLRAGGVSATTAGAVLLLGCSMGGELFNPGAVEIVTLSDLTGVKPTAVVEGIARWNLLASSAALAAFWLLHLRESRRRPEGLHPDGGAEPVEPGFRVHPLKALVPAVPIVILFAGPWVLGVPRLITLTGEGLVRLSDPASILVAMLMGVAAAGVTSPRHVARFAAAFFDGAGYAYVHVISLIVTATVFAEGVRATGLIDALAAAIVGRRALAVATAIVLPCGLARVCGSGIAPAVAAMRALVPQATSLGIDPIRLGALAAVAAHFGRTMSPAAAVVAMSVTLTGAERGHILRQVTTPLLAGLVVLTLAAWLR